jgi:hypothetical protein
MHSRPATMAHHPSITSGSTIQTTLSTDTDLQWTGVERQHCYGTDSFHGSTVSQLCLDSLSRPSTTDIYCKFFEPMKCDGGLLQRIASMEA